MGVRVPPFAPNLRRQGSARTFFNQDFVSHANITRNARGLERRLNVAVPIADIEGEVKKRLTRLARTVKVAGFRPGKAPLRMLDQQYGPQVRSDVISERVQSTFNDAIRAQNLRVAGTPRIEPQRGDQPATGTLEFSAVFEVYPEVQIGDVAEHRDHAAASPRSRRRTSIARSKCCASSERRIRAVERAAQSGDRVHVDFTGTIDGVEFAGRPGARFSDRARRRTDAAGIRGGGDRRATAGDTQDVPADVSRRLPRPGSRRQGSAVHVDRHRVEAPRLPALDSEFAKAFGIASGNVDDLRREVEANLRLELKRKVEATVKAQALSGLRQQATFAVPKALVDSEAQALRQRTLANLREQPNVKPENLELSLDVFRPQAEERVALGLIIAELVRSEQLHAKPEQIKALVTETAQTYEQPDAVVRWHYEKPERLRDFEAMALEQNVVDWILARAKVTDEPTTFEAIMGQRAGA